MADNTDKEDRDEIIDPKFYEPVLYKKRWLMLLLFASVSMLNAFQWIHLNIVADSVIYFWNGSLPADPYQQDLSIAWLSMIYMLSYIPLIIPATWLLDRYGLRVSIVLGAVLNALGAWLKCVSVQLSEPVGVLTTAASASFPVLMFAQTICSISQVSLLGMPAQLAVTWFGQNELPLATAIGVFGNQVGVALGFGIPPLVVPSIESYATSNTTQQAEGMFADFKRGFQYLLYGGAIIITVDLLLILIFFRNQPKHAPSRAQYARLLRKKQAAGADQFASKGDAEKERSEKDLSRSSSPVSSLSVGSLTTTATVFGPEGGGYKATFLKLFKNCSFDLLNICYGVNTGVYHTISTLLSVILLVHYPNDQVAIGWIGFTMVIAGLIGSIVAGVVLERTGLYRRVLIIFYVLSVVSFGFYIGSIYTYQIGVIFFAMFLLGFFQSGFLPLGFEYAAEITYPANEGLSSGILNMTAHIIGIFLTMVSTVLIDKYDGLAANLFMLATMVVAAIPSFFMKDDLKRQRAQRKAKEASETDLSVNEDV